ncbi:hypothetical protein GCM10012288_06010 [Malaciobacter pacificus]|uniref:Toxin-antitoxin system, toxin component, RelE/ParE family n=1 Tax=Malaciobacter pacificus TaxID=1080223 RepID=A0A5C2HC68_9BACT|nr:type II toxin-antitoxin system RelE/ParE family toxin [Malaciobacter pacificus]QEP33872.1 toxin-antitoxin system, toxin component, RelE/ParE family [Malaciobacter pacificus]GGD34828.1 hypothetical protein GCM10012288_06010 [Malaciobacter pacificus]
MKLIIKPLENFKKEAKKLAKKYKEISNDLKKLQEELLNNPKAGIDLGSNCYKIKIRGFRVIYYYIDQKGIIYLMCIYSKSDLENIEDNKILQLIEDNNL